MSFVDYRGFFNLIGWSMTRTGAIWTFTLQLPRRMSMRPSRGRRRSVKDAAVVAVTAVV